LIGQQHGRCTDQTIPAFIVHRVDHSWRHIPWWLLAFYAYIGFEDMMNIAEEIKQPEKILPKAILLAMVITTLCSI